ncbi:hypothetical protein [Belnapia rosea]|uniref:hypothetical protein n=1 Tax=Belnapia rosea TaxID=938405 RepID=UPI0015A36436|nr:hypothetical protein [Belnapia rosea]
MMVKLVGPAVLDLVEAVKAARAATRPNPPPVPAAQPPEPTPEIRQAEPVNAEAERVEKPLLMDKWRAERLAPEAREEVAKPAASAPPLERVAQPAAQPPAAQNPNRPTTQSDRPSRFVPTVFPDPSRLF